MEFGADQVQKHVERKYQKDQTREQQMNKQQPKE
jgi:hypothetical protein